MSLAHIAAGRDLSDDLSVVIETLLRGHPAEYKGDEDSGAMFVDGFRTTAGQIPWNYGDIPHIFVRRRSSGNY